MMAIDLMMVSRQPSVVVTISRAFFKPSNGYVKTGFCTTEKSDRLDTSPKSHFQDLTAPVRIVVLSEKIVGFVTQMPVEVKSGLRPG